MMEEWIKKDSALEICDRWRRRAKEVHDRDGFYIANIIHEQTEELIDARPQGEWIEDPINKNNMYCSNCKVSYTKDFLRGMSLYYEPKDTPNYCPNCGARMKELINE